MFIREEYPWDIGHTRFGFFHGVRHQCIHVTHRIIMPEFPLQAVDEPKNWHQAMEEEKMPWGQLIDNTKAAFRAYNLTGVPSSILVDEKGKIINVNARGGWLDAAMQEIYD